MSNGKRVDGSSKKESKGKARKWKHCQRNKECFWWARQLGGYSQGKNKLAWRYANRNFLNWKSKGIKPTSQQDIQELWDDLKKDNIWLIEISEREKRENET